ncbi:MAG: ABC transporter transmembrane domain-containing protein, partial [Anaerolineales bacterium]
MTTTLKTWPFNWRLIRYQPWVFIVHSLFTLVVFGLEFVPGLIEKSVFDTITGAAPATIGLWSLIALYVSVALARFVSSLGAEWHGWTFRYVVGALLRRNLFASILRRTSDNALPISPGEAINRLRNDVGEVADFPLWLPDQAGKIVAGVIAILIMARINLTITVVIFLPLVGIILLTRLAWGCILHYYRASAVATDAVTGFLGEAFGAVQAVKVANAEEALSEHLHELNEARRKAEVSRRFFEGLIHSINSSAVTFGIGVILLLAGQAISSGAFTIGDFALFVNYLWFTTWVPIDLGAFIGDYKTQEASIERIVEMIRPEPPEVLAEHHPVYERGDAPTVPLAPKTGADHLHRLEVRGLTYHYPGNGNGIESVNLSLARGSFTVIT